MSDEIEVGDWVVAAITPLITPPVQTGSYRPFYVNDSIGDQYGIGLVSAAGERAWLPKTMFRKLSDDEIAALKAPAEKVT